MASHLIGYYVHHHGSGHMMRAQEICRFITSPVILFSTREPFGPLPAHVTYIKLNDDSVGVYTEPVTSAFFYTPYDPVIVARYNTILDAIQTYGIRSMYVDVSVEVALFAKLVGMKVGFAAMHGVRTDTVHSLCYDAVDFLLSHNSQLFDTPFNRRTKTPVYYSGGISRIPNMSTDHINFPIRSIVVTTSRHNSALHMNDIERTAKLFPEIIWTVVGAYTGTSELPNVNARGVVDDIGTIYCEADIIVGTGGNNTIMEVASYSKPFVCIPEARAFDEQTEAACALARLHAAVYEPVWPSAERWSEIFVEISTLDLNLFHSLVDDQGAKHAATIIENAFTPI